MTQTIDAGNLCKKSVENRLRHWVFIALSSAIAIAIIICLICDYCISHSFTWSLIVAVSCVTAWLALLPCLRARTHRIRKTLIICSLVIIPYLALLSLLLNAPPVFRLGGCIALPAVAGCWGLYYILRKNRRRPMRALGWVFLMAIPVSAAVNYMVCHFIYERQYELLLLLIGGGAYLVFAAVCFVFDYFLCRTQDEGGS